MAFPRPQVLEINPPDTLIFKGPFDHVVTAELHLRNPTTKGVLFQVKTAAPRSYCVRPNNGIIEPNSSKEVSVMIQPMDERTYATRHTHKFLIVTVFAPANFKPNELNKAFRDTPEVEKMKTKLAPSFLEEDESTPKATAKLDQQPVLEEKDVATETVEVAGQKGTTEVFQGGM